MPTVSTRPAAFRHSVLAVVLLAATLLVGLHPSPVAAAAPAGSSSYVPLSTRLADTRPAQGAYGFTSLGATTMRVTVLGRAGVPADAVAAVVNVTAIGSSGPGFVTVYPAGQPLPTASNLNTDAAGRTIANLVHVKLGTGGAIDIYRSAAMNIAVDLVGVYVPQTDAVAGGRLITLASGAERAYDTRNRGYGIAVNGTESVDLSVAGLPAGALAAVVTVTAVKGNGGFWTAFANGTNRPNVSTLNLDGPGQTRAAQAIVPLGGSQRINLYSERGGDYLVDLVGWYTGDTAAVSTDGLFIPTSPFRPLDTRNSRFLAPWNGSTFEFGVTPPVSNVAAAVVNVTATRPWNTGFVTAYPAGLIRPGSSNLNHNQFGQTIAVHAITRVSNRGVALYTDAGVHLIADVSGWFLGTPSGAALPVPVNPNYQPNRAVAVYQSKIGLYLGIKTGTNLDAIADQGYAATWSDLVNVASPGNMMLFAHRTTGTGPFRYLNYLAKGDVFSLIGSDGHWYNYQVTEIRVTYPYYSAIAGLATPYGSVTAQLVACSKLDGTPTSTSWRIVVTGRLISVT